jgi:hypothetical protein
MIPSWEQAFFISWGIQITFNRCEEIAERMRKLCCLPVVANLDFNSLMGKVGGWKALSREWFDG